MKLKQNGKTINSYFIFIILLLLVIFGLNLLNNRTDEYTKAEFIADLDAGNVSEVVVQPNGEAPTGYLEIQMKNGVSHKLYATDITELETLVREYGFDPVVNDIERENWFLTYMLPMLVVLAVGIFLFMMMNAQQAGGGNGKMMNFGKSRAKMTLGDKSVTFAQVAGLKEEKEELEEIVDFLKEPGKYTGVGARIPKGVLLEGPPGTGKTLLAKAVAGEAGVPFFSISGSDFVVMFVGVCASRVRDLFEEAKHNAPCIVFIDEIDAVARRRGTGMGGGHDEREQTLNQLLVEMDGFGVNEGIIVMAATNRVDILDPAILRPGRFADRSDYCRLHRSGSGEPAERSGHYRGEGEPLLYRTEGYQESLYQSWNRCGEEEPYHFRQGEEDHCISRGRPCDPVPCAAGCGTCLHRIHYSWYLWEDVLRRRSSSEILPPELPVILRKPPRQPAVW